MFVCHCGSNIGGLIDCKKLAEYAKSLPKVAHSEDNLYTCSETGLSSIKKAIKEHNLNRVIVASCTPRTHEPLFRECISEAGLNPYLFTFVNIRDQCTWVHMKEPDKAYEKSRDLIRMGVYRAAKLEPLEKIKININPTALVIGGGVAGMSAAISLCKQGFKTYLIEKEKELGGRLRSLHRLFPHDIDASELLNKFYSEMEKLNNLIVHTSCTVKNLDGFIGNYRVELEKEGELINIDVGAIVVAIGSEVLVPNGLYSYDGKKVITQLQFEEILKSNQVNAKNLVMIQCAGSRNDDIPYCSSVCCMTALKNAIVCKELNPDVKITILFRDIFTPGTFYEEYYRKARENGVVFMRYTSDKPPIVENGVVKVQNQYLNRIIEIPNDLVVLSTPLIAREDNEFLAKLLKVPLESNKFFLEAHVKLRPVDFATDGVFVCGTAKWPTDISESITQGQAAASRAGLILSHETMEVEGATSYLPEHNKDLCKGCEVCIKVCPYKAIKKNEKGEIEIIQALCKGCGLCGASCTKKAITIKHFTNEQILSEIKALGGEVA